MQLTLILFPIALAIYGAIIYLFVLLVKALRKYIKSKDVREEKKAVCRSLGEALKAHRTEKQMTQEFVAETLGVSRQAVSKWENGTSDPSTSGEKRGLKQKRDSRTAVSFHYVRYFSSSGSEKSVFKTPV